MVSINERQLTIEKLKEELRYEADTGNFYWVKRKAGRPYGRPAGTQTGNKRIAINLEGYQYQADRLAWYYTYGTWPEAIRHKNEKNYDNRLENLENISTLHREATYRKKRIYFNRW